MWAEIVSAVRSAVTSTISNFVSSLITNPLKGFLNNAFGIKPEPEKPAAPLMPPGTYFKISNGNENMTLLSRHEGLSPADTINDRWT